MLQIAVAIVSSLGETGLTLFYHADCQNEARATQDMPLLAHETELHYHSLEPMASPNPQLASAEELKQKYGKEKSQKKFVQNVDENLSATHKVFLRTEEHCSTTQ